MKNACYNILILSITSVIFLDVIFQTSHILKCIELLLKRSIGYRVNSGFNGSVYHHGRRSVERGRSFWKVIVASNRSVKIDLTI